MKKKLILLNRILYIAVFLLFSGCLSVMEKTGQVLDGSAFAEKRIALYRGTTNEMQTIEVLLVENKAAERSVIITLNKFPMMKLRGSAPDENNKFYLTSLEYLGGSVQGWNEYTLDLLGEGSLSLSENAILLIDEDIEPVQISAGRIQRFDTRIIGSDALTSLRNRRERIVSIAEWMRAVNSAPRGQVIKDFENYWKPIFFPEIVSQKQKPSGWLQEDDLFSKAEDIQWNTNYTDRVFPEELISVRNSGTLLRDWEEALPWIYLEYEWENIVNILSRQIILQKIK